MSGAEFGLFEFSVGSTVGIREFDVDSLGRLTGVTHKVVWKPGENLAQCKRIKNTTLCTEEHEHVSWQYLRGMGSTYQPDPSSTKRAMMNYVPGLCTEPDPCEGLDPDCGCGFYAYYGDVSAYRGMTDVTVTGVVECFGKTIVGTKGFRAEKGRILALCFPEQKPEPPLADRIKKSRISVALKAFGMYFAPPLATVPAVAFTPQPWQMLPLGLFGATVGCSIGTFSIRRSTAKASKERKEKYPVRFPDVPTPPEILQQVKANYADVPQFATVGAMLQAFPTDQLARSLTPASDPSFWDREVTA